MNWQDWLYPLSVLILAYVAMGITGFGSALIAVPLLAWKWPLPEAVALTILLDVPASALHGGMNFRQVGWKSVRDMLPGMALGTLLGLWLMGQLDKRWPLFFLGVYIAMIGLRSLRAQGTQISGISGRAYHIGSTLVGLIEVMFATAGPVVMAMLQKRLKDVREVRATVPVAMIAAGSIAILVLLNTEASNPAVTLRRWMIAMPVAALGVFLGNRIAGRIPVSVLARLMAALLLCSGLALTRHLWL